jgi:tRNA G37 N-methylase TrmD
MMILSILTPDGETFNQKIANTYSLKKNLILFVVITKE